jgi:hydroxymethylpyrimidine pyrophosphatase-like HAD family hydrolase
MLDLSLPLVCNSGALVKDPGAHRTLWRVDLEPEVLAAVLHQFRRAGHPVVSFTDHDPVEGPDMLVERYPIGQVGFDEYVSLNQEHAGIDPDWLERACSGRDAQPHFHVCAIGERPAMQELEAKLHRVLNGQIRTFVQKSPRYIGWMCEVLHHDASKWSALMHLAQQWGIPPQAICAVGDDHNDVPMLQGAGLGVAMGHAPPEVQAIADRVIGDHHSEGLAEFLEQLMANEA